MSFRGVERRLCRRFIIPGATLYYKKIRFFLSGNFSRDYFPLVDISRGGLMFQSQDYLAENTRLLLRVVIPNEEKDLMVKGIVRWVSQDPGRNYKYRIGIGFDPYGSGRSMNDPAVLDRLRELEQRFPEPA